MTGSHGQLIAGGWRVTETLPKREKHYRTYLTDSARWDHFTARADDVFVCAPARSGTTWTQTLCCLLLFGWRDFTLNPTDVSPWYDAVFHPIEEVNALLEAQDHRRLIKTHTPLDGIPYEPQSTYVCVYRDPRDVFLSVRSHLDNFERSDFTLDPAEDLSAPFQNWLCAPTGAGVTESRSLETITNHYWSYRRYDHLPNLHFMHYADMKRDLHGNVAGLAQALKIDVSSSDIAEICRIAQFDNMRDNAAQFAPYAGTGMWKDDKEFFSRGTGGRWRGVLGAEDVAAYDARVLELLPAEHIGWLHDGAGGQNGDPRAPTD